MKIGDVPNSHERGKDLAPKNSGLRSRKALQNRHLLDLRVELVMLIAHQPDEQDMKHLPLRQG